MNAPKSAKQIMIANLIATITELEARATALPSKSNLARVRAVKCELLECIYGA